MIRISNVKIYEDISNEEIFNIVIKKYKILKQDVHKLKTCDNKSLSFK